MPSHDRNPPCGENSDRGFSELSDPYSTTVAVALNASVPDPRPGDVNTADDELLARADNAERDPSTVDLGNLSHEERNKVLFGLG